MANPRQSPSHRVAFLLSQLGSLAAAGFAERVKSVGLSPGEAGILRLVGRNPGLNQRLLADRLGLAPSRLVALIDALEARDLVARTRSSTDRRNYELSLSDSGSRMLAQLRGIAAAQDDELLSPLSPDQRQELAQLLATLASAHGADADLHRGTGT